MGRAATASGPQHCEAQVHQPRRETRRWTQFLPRVRGQADRLRAFNTRTTPRARPHAVLQRQEQQAVDPSLAPTVDAGKYPEVLVLLKMYETFEQGSGVIQWDSMRTSWSPAPVALSAII